MANKRRQTPNGFWINRNGKPIISTHGRPISHVGEGNKLITEYKPKRLKFKKNKSSKYYD